MIKFSGLCVGGPKDGEMLENSSPSFRCHIFPDEPGLGTNPIPIDYAIKTKTYIHDQSLWDELGVSFWLYDGMTKSEAITKILTTYMATVRNKRKK